MSLLPFAVVSHDGGEFSSDYRAENMIKDDMSVYCTELQRNANVLLHFAPHGEQTGHTRGEDPFALTHVIVKSPEQGFTAPLRRVMVFVLWDRPIISEFRCFDDYTPEQYANLIAQRRKEGQGLQQSDPAAYIDLLDGWHAIQKLEFPRAGRWVLVKLLRAKNYGSNIDVQFLGFKGFVGPRAFATASLA